MTGTWWRTALGAGREPSADQEAAIVAPAIGRRTVNAGAGTGKTATLALRALQLIESGAVRADELVVVTFTKKAAAEIGGRIADTLDRARAAGAALDAPAGVSCTTIHALAAALRREFAYDFGAAEPPRAISDGEAQSIFHASFRVLLNDELAVDTTAFPLAENGPETLERDLGRLALRLKNLGISPAAFAREAHAAADAFAAQTWEQLWSPGRSGKRSKVAPPEPLTTDARARDVRRERANIDVAHALFADFDMRLERAGVATYGDLIGTTTRLLRERPWLIARLRARWRYVLLDESQDTSDLQLAFIETLFGTPGDPDAAGIMPVGDPRQAIYGFNGADEYVMERLTRGSADVHPLIVNRRSPQEIVDAAHFVLERAGIVDDATPRLQASAGCAGLSAVRVQCFGTPGETVKEHVAHESAAIAREVCRLLRDETIAPSDIAILVRRRTHAAAYVRALNAVGVGAALDRRSGLFAADEVRDALAWFAWLTDVNDRQAAVRILQSPVCGLDDAAMIALAAERDWLNELLRGAAPRDRASAERTAVARTFLERLFPVAALPLATAVERVLDEVPIAAGYAALGSTVGAQAILNLRGMQEAAREFARAQPAARLRDFVADVRRRMLYDDDPPEAELDLDGVRVLTVHQAKGLEWPFVFVACSTSRQYAVSGDTDSVVNFDRATGAFTLKNDIDGRETFRWITTKSEHDPRTGERREPGDRKTAAEREQARIFYVALTRARRRVYVTAPVPPGTNGALSHLDSVRAWAESVKPGADLRFDDPDANTATAPAVSAPTPRSRTPLLAEPPAQVEPAPQPPRLSFSAVATFATCPRQARYRYRLRLPGLALANASSPAVLAASDGDGPVADDPARRGSLIHRALEHWGAARIGGAPLSPEEACDAALAGAAGVDDVAALDVRACVEAAASALGAYTFVAVESPFELRVAGARLEGAIDCIARAPDGEWLVIDYKTGRRAADHDALQLALYVRSVRGRFGAADVGGAILRLRPGRATFEQPRPLSDVEVERAVSAAGAFESDLPNVGRWCASCAYRDAPCTAPDESLAAAAASGAG